MQSIWITQGFLVQGPRRRGASVGERSAAKGPRPTPWPRTIAGEGMKGKRTVDANVSKKSGERGGTGQSELHWATETSSRSRSAVNGPLPYPLLGQESFVQLPPIPSGPSPCPRRGLGRGPVVASRDSLEVAAAQGN